MISEVKVEGRSAVIVPIALPPSLEAVRVAGDRMAARGVPPHVTILFPFLPVGALTSEVRADLAELAARRPSFVARFDLAERLAESVWLLPADQRPFLGLTADVVARWPDYLPYEGAHDVLIAHLTLVETSDLKTVDGGSAAASSFGSFDTAVTELAVITEDEAGRWRAHWRIPFGPAAGSRKLDR